MCEQNTAIDPHTCASDPLSSLTITSASLYMFVNVCAPNKDRLDNQEKQQQFKKGVKQPGKEVISGIFQTRVHWKDCCQEDYILISL